MTKSGKNYTDWMENFKKTIGVLCYYCLMPYNLSNNIKNRHKSKPQIRTCELGLYCTEGNYEITV